MGKWLGLGEGEGVSEGNWAVWEWIVGISPARFGYIS